MLERYRPIYLFGLLKGGPAILSIVLSASLFPTRPALAKALILFEIARSVFAVCDQVMQRARGRAVHRSATAIKVALYLGAMGISVAVAALDVLDASLLLLFALVLFFTSQRANFIFREKPRTDSTAPSRARALRPRLLAAVGRRVLRLGLTSLAATATSRAVYALPAMSSARAFLLLRALDLLLMLAGYASQKLVTTGRLTARERGVLWGFGALIAASALLAPYWGVLYLVRLASLLLCAQLVFLGSYGTVAAAQLLNAVAYLLAFAFAGTPTWIMAVILVSDALAVAFMYRVYRSR